MLGHRKPGSVVAYTSQMFAETTPEVSSSLTNVKKWASAAGYAIEKILGLTSEMVIDGKGLKADFGPRITATQLMCQQVLHGGR